MRSELAKILDTMDIPALRKELTESNLRWLNRNILVRNSQHPDVEKALVIIRQLLLNN